jgi:hypothetical protein
MSAKVIEHQQAIQGMMVERYLLNELTESDLEAFEGHLFDCTTCFEQVKAGTEFIAYLKRISADDAGAVTIQPGWGQRMGRMLGQAPAMIFAGLFLCATFFNVSQEMAFRRLTAPGIVTPETLHQETRAGDKPITPSRNGYFELRTRFNPAPGLNSYRARIVSDAGQEAASIAIPETDGEVQLRLHARMFHSGKYTLFITAADQANGGSTKTLGQYPFELKLQD